MAYGFGNRTIRDGLVFYLDAINPSSYYEAFDSPAWKSISKDSSIGEIRGNAVFDSDYLGRKAIRFDGTNSAVTGKMGTDNLLDINKTGVITVQIFFSISSTQSNKWLFGAGIGGDDNQYAVGLGTSVNYGMQPIIYAGNNAQSMPGVDLNLETNPYRLFTVEFGSTTRKVYWDETYSGEHSISHTTKPGNEWVIGDRPGGGACLNGAIQSIRVYNRQLSADEISNIYQFYINR